MVGEARTSSAEEAGRELADRLEARGVPYAIGGALALAQWGIPRGTIDVDMNIWVDPARPTSAAQLLGDLGCDLKSSSVIRSFTDTGWAYALILYRAKDLADLESLAVLNARSLDAGYVLTWIAALTGANDVRVATWNELTAAAKRAAGLRENGWRPPQEE
jgi:hypothetical protein